MIILTEVATGFEPGDALLGRDIFHAITRFEHA